MGSPRLSANFIMGCTELEIVRKLAPWGSPRLSAHLIIGCTEPETVDKLAPCSVLTCGACLTFAGALMICSACLPCAKALRGHFCPCRAESLPSQSREWFRCMTSCRMQRAHPSHQQPHTRASWLTILTKMLLPPPHALHAPGVPRLWCARVALSPSLPLSLFPSLPESAPAGAPCAKLYRTP